MKYILPVLFLMCFPNLAQASSWMECKGTGKVQKVQEQDDGTHLIEVKLIEAVVTDGMAGKGDACFFGMFPVILEISSPESFDLGAVVPLKYRSYSGMGENGPVSSNTWSLATEE